MNSALTILEPFIFDEAVRSSTMLRIWDRGKRLIWAARPLSAINEVASALVAGVEDGRP